MVVLYPTELRHTLLCYAELYGATLTLLSYNRTHLSYNAASDAAPMVVKIRDWAAYYNYVKNKLVVDETSPDRVSSLRLKLPYAASAGTYAHTPVNSHILQMYSASVR